MTTNQTEMTDQRVDQPEDLWEDMQEVEYRVVGPPGCGKTTWLGKQVELAVSNEQEVMIVSLTKSAAAEISGRDLPISPENLGTLHSICYRSLQRPTIAESKDNLLDWNERYPNMALSISSKNSNVDLDNLETVYGSTSADNLLAEYQIARARMNNQMSTGARYLGEKWEEWKKEKYLLDFTDLIETCLHDVATAPMDPDIIFVDEAQDLDMLEMSLIRKWGLAAGKLVVVGDPDQAIFTWRGADPRAFAGQALPDDHRWVLGQSHRLSKMVHNQAVSWIDQSDNREQVIYSPREEEGEVRSIRSDWNSPEDTILDAEKYMAQGKKVMFLASCSYMLQPLIKAMRNQGIPFHNPYRTMNGAWNPLAKRKNMSSAADRIVHFLTMSQEASWTPEQLANWLKNMKTKDIFTPTGKDWVKGMNKFSKEQIDYNDLEMILTPETLQAGMEGDLNWYENHLVSSKIKGSEFPLQVLRASENDIDSLREEPKALVGTIHSVKGGEAEVVYLFPDVSLAGAREWNGNNNQKAYVYRLFYVGMTRAKETLVLCAPREDEEAVTF